MAVRAGGGVGGDFSLALGAFPAEPILDGAKQAEPEAGAGPIGDNDLMAARTLRHFPGVQLGGAQGSLTIRALENDHRRLGSMEGWLERVIESLEPSQFTSH